MKLKSLVLNELKILARNKMLLFFLTLTLFFWVISLTISLNEYRQEAATREEYKAFHRKMWVDQFPKNPHMAAHFGTFAFKPANPLSLFEKGISAYSGTFIYLEAHRQNDFICTPAQNTSVYNRLGEFNISFLLQYAIPLLIVLLTAGMFSFDKKNGLLQFVVSNSVGKRLFFISKALAVFWVVLLPLVLVFSGTTITAYFSGLSWTKDEIIKLFLLFAAYLLFYTILIIGGLIISLYSIDFKKSFITACFVWIGLFFIIPKIAVNLADNLYELPTNLSFREDIKKDIDNGIDGHSRGDRENLVIDSVLKQYHVDSTYKLPINIDGVLLKKGEEYSSAVYQHHFHKIRQAIANQQMIARLVGIADPLAAIKDVSMTLCNNNTQDEFNFRDRAEDYRLYFVQTLNDNMMRYSKETEFNTYKVGDAVYRQIKNFTYTPFSVEQTVLNALLDLTALIVILAAFVYYLIRLK